jgi:hypothetical protein
MQVSTHTSIPPTSYTNVLKDMLALVILFNETRIKVLAMATFLLKMMYQCLGKQLQ